MRIVVLTTVILLVACESGNYKTPTISNANASGMSDATLCYRYAGARKSGALKEEVDARGIDCGAMLEDDPLFR